MAVQAQYPSNFWLSDIIKRNSQENQELFGSAIASDHAFYNPDKKLFHTLAGTPQLSSSMALVQEPQPQQQQCHQQQERSCLMTNLEDLRLPNAQNKSSTHSPVFIGLRLSLEDQQNQTNLSFMADDLSLLLNQHQEEIDHLVRLQGHQLRRSLIAERQKQYGTLVAAVDRVVTRKLKQKESEREQVNNRNADLEQQLEQLRAQSLFWQAKAHAQEAVAAALQARLASAAQAQPNRAVDEPGDAESSTSEPEAAPGFCRACRGREASMVVLPCRHLCICSVCAVLLAHCPVCGCARTAFIQACLS